MRCAVCRLGSTTPGRATVTLEHDGTVLVVRGVPAEICTNCSEEYIAETVAAHLLDEIAGAVRTRSRLVLRDWSDGA